MSVGVNIIYPVSDGSHFDAEYYFTNHMKLVSQKWGPFYESCFTTRGDTGPEGQPPAYHATATMVFKDKSGFEAAMENGKEILADVANFTNVQPDVLIGEYFEYNTPEGS